MSPGEEQIPDPDHAYFLAIEEIFVRLRGAPLLLAPADWRGAQRWHRQGVPLDLVRRAMEEVFARRAERGAKGKISSLRYVAPAIEAVWADWRELAAPGEREEGAPEVDRAGRLGALAAALPAALPGREELAARVAALDGDSEAVEAALSALDREMMAAVERALGEEERAEVARTVEATVAHLAGRLDAAEVDRARARLERQVLRQRLALPVLSLFSPEAQTGRGA